MELIVPPTDIDTKAKGRKRAVDDKTSASKRAKVGEGDSAEVVVAADDAQPHSIEAGTGLTVYQIYHRAFEYAACRACSCTLLCVTQPDLFIPRYDSLSSRASASVLTRYGPAAAAACHTLLIMSRDNIVCNRSILKFFKVDSVFTELQSLRAAGATLPANATPMPTMSLAEVTRAAELLCNCAQVLLPAM
jgi:hypothetical protein